MKKILIPILWILLYHLSFAQGPPITADKPIMLGGQTYIFKTLTEVRITDHGNFLKMPLMAHYLPSANTLAAIHIPLVSNNLNGENGSDGLELGDIGLLFKYQFFRKDGKAKTVRMVAKMYHSLPTGPSWNEADIATGNYESHYSVVVGYETIKYGLSGELGYHIDFESSFDYSFQKAGFGLPLLKPTYPVNQINLYFEYENRIYSGSNFHELYYAQGIQYAKGRLTMEGAVQIPLIDKIPEANKRKYSILLGVRFII